MLGRLRKLAHTGAALSRLALEKDAMLKSTIKQVARGAGKTGSWALANPHQALVTGLGTAAAAGAGAKTYHSFNPAVQRRQLGMES